jgi:hypothetical protein
LSEDVRLVRENNRNLLYVVLSGDPEVLTSSAERKEHFQQVQRANSYWFQKKLRQFRRSRLSKVRIADSEHKLEFISGDTCLILAISGREYVLSAMRNITPLGWVIIPSGCSNKVSEIPFPEQISKRELSEEVILGDGKVFYNLGSRESLELGLARWGLKAEKIIPIEAETLFFPDRGDAQGVVFLQDGKEVARQENVDLTVDADLGIVCATFYKRVRIPCRLSDLRVYDGEFNEAAKALIKRPVRLTTPSGRTVALFINGTDVLHSGWTTKMNKRRGTFRSGEIPRF